MRSRSLQKTLLASSSAASLLGPKTRSFACFEGVHDSFGQGAFRADDRQPDLVVPGKADQGRKVIGGESDVFRVDRGAGIAGGHEHPLGPGALLDLPGQGVLAPAIADYQDVHALIGGIAGLGIRGQDQDDAGTSNAEASWTDFTGEQADGGGEEGSRRGTIAG